MFAYLILKLLVLFNQRNTSLHDLRSVYQAPGFFVLFKRSLGFWGFF